MAVQKKRKKNSPERNGNVGKDTGLKSSVISGGKKSVLTGD